MPKISLTLQYKTSKIVFLHTLLPIYNSTYTYPQVLTSEPSENLTLTTELYFTSNPNTLKVAKDKNLCDALLSIRSA